MASDGANVRISLTCVRFVPAGSRHQTPENADDRLPPRQQTYQGNNGNDAGRSQLSYGSNSRNSRPSRGVPPSGGPPRQRRPEDRRRINDDDDNVMDSHDSVDRGECQLHSAKYGVHGSFVGFRIACILASGGTACILSFHQVCFLSNMCTHPG